MRQLSDVNPFIKRSPEEEGTFDCFSSLFFPRISFPLGSKGYGELTKFGSGWD